MKQRTLKYLLLSFAICLMLISIGALSACAKHVHNFGDYEILSAADCETTGEKAHTCLSCGYTETEVIPSGHDWSDFVITKYADCETKGEQKRICAVCKYEDIEVLPAIGHNWSEFTVISPAKCDAEGKQIRSCSNCGTEDIKTIPFTEHSWSEFEITVPAKCEVTGKQTRTCETCKKKETVDLPALEHSWSDYEITPATCNKVGAKIRTCDLCKATESAEIPKLEHKWSAYVETVSATCEHVGEKTRSCDLCHVEESVEIPKAEHMWSAYSVVVEAKCGVKGEKKRSCDVCHIEEKAEIAALQHVWEDEKITKDPTCVDEGLKTVKCKLCETVNSEEVIPALGHTAGKVLPVESPSCEQEGTNRVTCSVCGKGYNEKVPATGHNYSEEFTIDTKPTISSEGEQSRHCLNYKCTSRTDVQVIPRLIGEAYYRIKIVRGDNQTLPRLFNPRLKIVDETGKSISGFHTAFANGDGENIYEILLPLGKYTISISNTLPDGFVCDTYEISELDGTYPYDTEDKYPTIIMHMYSYLGTGINANGDKKGTVLNDFSVTTIDGKTVWISELLAEKRMVWLNFYYNDCSPCQSEASEIVRIATMFDVAVICFNGKDSVENIRSGAKSIFNFPDSFYLVDDTSAYYGKMFDRGGYPLNVFIDSGGYVFESVSGSTYSSQFYNFVSQNLFTTPPRTATVSQQYYVQMPAILPDEVRIYEVK